MFASQLIRKLEASFDQLGQKARDFTFCALSDNTCGRRFTRVNFWASPYRNGQDWWDSGSVSIPDALRLDQSQDKNYNQMAAEIRYWTSIKDIILAIKFPDQTQRAFDFILTFRPPYTQTLKK